MSRDVKDMKIGESKIKFVKKANMWVKTTLLDKIRKTSKKTGQPIISDKLKQEWFLGKPATTSNIMELEEIKVDKSFMSHTYSLQF